MRKRFLAISVVGAGLFLAGLLMGQSASQRGKTEPPSVAACAPLQRMRDFEAQTAKLYKANVLSKFELASTQFYVAEAEELLAQARAT